MLQELSIENFAVIDRLHVRFDAGFTVLTGETGAGKSIIVDALQTALGSRTSSDVVRGEARYATVEAIFDWPPDLQESLRTILDEQGIETGRTLILRREIQSSGRSTARVNGRAVSLPVLSSIGDLVVDIHGQSDHLAILKRDRQLDVLDRFGDLTHLRARVSQAIREYVAARSELQALTEGQRSAMSRLDLLRFQVQEIDAAGLEVDEEELLATERNVLANAEKLAQWSAAVYDGLHSDTTVDAVVKAAASMRDLSAIDPSLLSTMERVEAVQVELDDIAHELRHYRDSIEYDPQRLDAIEERVELLSRLKRKYGASVPDIIMFGEQAQKELEGVERYDERIRDLELSVGSAAAEAGERAGELSRAREKAAQSLSEAMGDALQGLGLKGTRFEVDLGRREADDGLPLPGCATNFAYTLTGIDTINFLVSFNIGEPLRALERVASGGETSRFLLALKSVLAGADRTPTLIFDEVDVGVGGRAGSTVGERLRSLSRRHQVLSITHLPQVAALADSHLAVFKEVSGERTTVDVRVLSPAEREEEVAHMMSGSVSEAARQSARELLGSRRPKS